MRKGPRPRPLADRFWEGVRRGDGCWEWVGQRRRNGYGCISINHSVKQLAHRVAWELLVGPIPAGMSVLHHCDNPGCVRPDHLYIGTQRENMRDAMQRDRVAYGARHWRVLLTDEQVASIVRRKRGGESAADLAREFRCSQSHVYNLANGQFRTRVTQAL